MENISSIGVFEAHKPILFTGNENKVAVTKACKNDAFVSTSAKEAKSASHSIGRMFRAAAIALGITVGAASCGSDPVIDDIKPKPPVNPTPVLSEAQKETNKINNAMYSMKGADENSAIKELSILKNGQQVDQVFDYRNRDTTFVNVTVKDPKTGSIDGIMKEKRFLQNGVETTKTFVAADEMSFNAKKWVELKDIKQFKLDQSAKVIESRSGLDYLKYIPKNDSTITTKAFVDGTEKVIKILKLVR